MTLQSADHKPFLDQQNKTAYKAYVATAKAVRESAAEVGVDRRLAELINVRVSQINGCAYCLDVHVLASVKAGEDPRRLGVLDAWRDTELFTPRERSALTLAEVTTQLPDARTRERELAFTRANLNDDEYAAVAWIAVTINAFNRVSIISGHPVR